MRWSFSASRSFSRCPRQFYYGQIAAYHAAKKDPLRREAFLLKQRKSLPLWRGNLVHDAIENLILWCPRGETDNRQTGIGSSNPCTRPPRGN